MIGGTLVAVSLTISLWQLARFTQSFRSKTLLGRITLRESTPPSVASKLFLSKLSRRGNSSKRLQRALFELPDIMELLTVALASGESIYNALARVIDRADGLVAREFSHLIRAVELGSTLEAELAAVADQLPQQQVIEFCNKLALAIRRGTPLAKMLRDQSQSVRHEVQNQISAQAGKNETRMMIPLVFLILPVTVLFAIYPSLQLLNVQAI